MDDEMVRAHVVLPRELVEEVDRLVGRRKRSAYFAAAVSEKLQRDRLGHALATTAGSLDREAYPEWETPEKVSAWVRALRSGDWDVIEDSDIQNQPA